MKKILNRNNCVFLMLFILSLSIFLICGKNSDNTTLDEVRLKDVEEDSGMFAIMIEDSDNSDTYKEYKESNGVWPGVGYLFNSEKSSCMDSNGEKVEDVQITFNAETHQISVSTHKTVYCYLYFKKDSKVPDVTNFYVGTHHGSEYTNVNTNKTVHIEWNDEDAEEYCIKEETETNDSSNCVWKPIEELSPVDLEASHKVETTIDLGTENKKYDFDVFLKDRAGNESTVDEISEDEIILDTQAPTISNISKVGEAKETSIGVSVTVNDPLGTDGTAGSGVEHIYYQIKEKNSGTIKETYHDNGTVTSYTFDDNLTAGTEYTVEVYAVDLAGNTSTAQTLDVTTKKLSASDTLTSNPGIYLKQSNKGDLKWRYVGTQEESSSINNYVCFGASSCTGETDNHLYRIIGITEQGNLKIQKNKALESTAQWHTSYQSDTKWPQSTMYTSTLSSFYNDGTYVSQDMKNKIEEHKWNTGDVQSYSDGITVYNAEKTTTSHTGAVGLAYLSDYYFAYKEDGSQNCNSGDYCKSWMVPSNYQTLWSSQSYEWTMTRSGPDGSFCNAWVVGMNGYVTWHHLNVMHAVRPVFYLKSEVTISGGEGTSSSPYIIN